MTIDAVPEANAPQDWDQLAALRLALHPHIRANAHQYRGQRWIVLHDLSSNRHHRFTDEAYQTLELLDGERSLAQVLELAGERLGCRAPDAVQLTALLRQLQEAELLNLAGNTTPEQLSARLRSRKRSRWHGRLLSPLAVRLRILDPDAWLERTASWVTPLLNRAMFGAWLLVVLAASVAAAVHWPELLSHWDSRGLDPETIALFMAAYLVLKALHELGHAYTVKAHGGEVHEIGVMFIVFVPLPYVDASAANGFTGKRERMLVGAAGIIVETFIASGALLTWCITPTGIVGNAAFAIALTGSLSTLVFNANPLLRFDGYYVLADWLEIPNLAARSLQYLRYLAQRYLLRLPDAISPVTAPGERKWFVLYGIGSFAYRILLTVSIALFIAGKAFVLGVALAAWFLFAQIVMPMKKSLSFLLLSPRLSGRRLRALGLMTTATAAFAAATWIPLPDSTSAVGIVRLSESGVVRAGVDGFVTHLNAADGATVVAGARLLELSNPELRSQIRSLEHRRSELATRLAKSMLEDRVQLALAKSELEDAEARLANAMDELERLDVVSPRAGTFVLHEPRGLLGRYVNKGDVIGYVTQSGEATAQVVVPQTEVSRVRDETREIRFRLASAPGTTYTATLRHDVPSGTDRLPSGALGSMAGGRIAVDSRDDQGIQTLDPVFEFDLALPETGQPYPIGARVYVRFEHTSEPVAWRWSRQIRRMLLERFAI